jgi:tetratricopeptide (TPR) repeat protein/transglutaminase-like putative cysteine protease
MHEWQVVAKLGYYVRRTTPSFRDSYLKANTYMRALRLSGTLLLLISSAWAQTSGSAAKPATDYSQQPFVREVVSETFRFQNDGTGRRQTIGRIKINGESAVQRFGQLKVGYSALSDKLEISYVRVIKPDGTIINAPESGMQDVTYPNALMYSDYHEKHISVPSLRPGDVLEYQFVRNTVDPLTPGEFWTDYDFNDHDIVLDERLEINVPKGRPVKLKNEPGFEPKITEEGDRRIYRWSSSHLEDDDDSQAKSKSTSRRDDDKAPTVQLTTFQSWQQVGEWYAALEKDRRQPTDAIKAKAAQLMEGKTTDTEKVRALFDFVSRDFRYVSLSFGQGRYQPHPASEVLANGYGDCKDKNTLLAALLAAQGFQSTSVLIGAQHKLDPDIPSPMQFDHVITRVPVDGKDIWLDSTSGVAPFQMLGFQLRDKQALAVPPGGTPELVRTPANLPFENFDKSRIEGALNDTGKLTAHVNMSGRGDSEMLMRYVLQQVPNNRWKEIFDGALNSTPMKGAEITNLKIDEAYTSEKPIEIDFDVAVSNYFDWSAPNPKLAVPMMPYQLPAPPEDDSKNPKPIKFGGITVAGADVKVGVPAKYSVRLPIGVDVKRDYAEYHSSYKFEDGQLIASRMLKTMVIEVPYERRDDYAAFRRTIEADQAQFITLDNKSPGTAGVAKDQSSDELFESAIKAASNNNFGLAIELLERVAQEDPKHKGLWVALGHSYLSDNQFEKAADTFKKGIEANPYDAYAYTALGAAYEGMQRYDEAIAQYQKAIEISPLDAYAHASRGALYSKLKRWNDAVPELEKAASLQDKNALLQAALGQAYIASGQTDKGMAAFDRAIAESPTAGVWNNIAYALSEQDVQLDRASQYSDAAINALETQLRDVNLDNLRMQDAAAADLLYAVWDTKGWVEFKRGNLDAAERYILAAWNARGAGEVAQHLGEIAEKRGMKDEAIRYYIAALAVDSPSMEARSRLAALGVTGDLESRISAARAEQKTQRTRKLSASGKGSGDFFVLATPAKTEQVKFVSGEPEVQALADSVKSADLGIVFPDASSVRALRRGTVSCGTFPPPKPTPSAKKAAKGSAPSAAPPANRGLVSGPCTFELLSDTIRSIN